MALRSTAHSRLLLIGLTVAGAVAGTAGTAFAQYYGGYYDDTYESYAPRYYEHYAPVPPAPIAPRYADRAAIRDYGLAAVERTVRTQSSLIIDGRTSQGRRVRLIVDRYSGDLVDRIALPEPRNQAPRMARIDPREKERQAPRLEPRPPQRPKSLQPPTEASAPATQPAPSLVAPPRTEPVRPQAPATASAPATVAPAAPAAPPRPTPDATDPGSGTAKPKLVNPNDVRGIDPSDQRQPPLAAASPAARPAPAPIEFPPFKVDDVDPGKQPSAGPAMPLVAPLE